MSSNNPRHAKIFAEDAEREKEALRIYRPMPNQLPFHQSLAKERIVRGGKRSGKTVSVAMEFASLVTGIPMTGPDGNPLPMKERVSTPSDKMRYWVIGYESRHIGETIFHKLFSPGLFRIIKDKGTGQWRPFNDVDPADAARFDESEPAGPAIPERMIKPRSWVWENKAENYFKSVELTNGAMIHAYISTAPNPKQGDDVHGIWIDEDIRRASHLKEWQDRLTKVNGWLIWSVWPHGANSALIGLLQRAKKELESNEPKPTIQAFKLAMTDSQYISQEAKDVALARMGSDDEIARRNEGELLMDQLVMYDFHPVIHCVKAKELEQPLNIKEVIQDILYRQGELPATWTRYLSVDPSHTRTGILLGTVPPREWERYQLGNLIIIERELVMKKALASDIAKAVKQMIGHWYLEAMVMDQNAGRQTHAGRDTTTAQYFAEAFAAAGVEARTGKSTFIPGCNEPPKRYAAVREFMRINPFGIPTILFIENKTVLTQQEFGGYTKKTIDDGGGDMHIFDEPANPRIYDLMAALEYLVTYLDERFRLGNAYMAPSAFAPKGSAAFQFVQQFVLPSQAESYTHLGPGRAA